MKEIETIEERLQRYFIAEFILTPEEGRCEAKEVIKIFYEYIEEMETRKKPLLRMKSYDSHILLHPS